MTRHDIFAMINRERARQDDKYGNFNAELTLSQFMVILGEEYGECCKEVCDLFTDLDNKHKELLKTELIQLISVAVQMLEHFDLKSD